MEELIKKLQYAKEVVLWLIEHADGLVDFHDLAHWAKEVMRLRKEVKSAL